MTNKRRGEVILDPQNADSSMDQMAEIYDLSPEDLDIIRRVIALYSQPVRMYLDEAITILHESTPLGDRFTFDIETDDLVLFSPHKETLIDALIEMAMYLAGFTTMMGSEESWVIEFTAGAWKPVKTRLKRQLEIPVNDHPRGVVGMPPSAETTVQGDPYPFRTLVSHYDLASFHQMVLLAARDDIAVYFPPETHPKVLAVYVYMRRSMQEVAQGIDLEDYQTFNVRLLEEIQRLENLFEPASLTLPTWLHDRHSDEAQPRPHPPSGPGREKSNHPADPRKIDPFEAFIDQLFSEDEDQDQGSGV
jgi:hypothetical protein